MENPQTTPKRAIDRVLELLAGNGVRRRFGGYQARCPAHDDNRSSLSVTVGDVDGRVLLHCHAGCQFPEILAALEINSSALFNSGPRHYQEKKAPPVSKRVALYEYRDETSKILYEVVRYEPKDFRIRVPKNGKDSSGGYHWALGDTRRVLYRLPQIFTQPSATVLFSEGEKDADALAKIGFIATTIAGGANAPWCDGYSKSLEGRNVVVIPDHDGPGWNFARTVVSSLSQTTNVSVLHLPGLKEKQDVSDWLSAGGTAERLRSLASR